MWACGVGGSVSQSDEWSIIEAERGRGGGVGGTEIGLGGGVGVGVGVGMCGVGNA